MLLLMLTAGGGSAQNPNVILVHGAGSTGATWNVALPQFQLALPGVSVSAPSISQNQSLFLQGDYLATLLSPSLSVLTGHSQGGVISRRATATVPAKGIVTVGTPHYGAPLANVLGDVISTLNVIAFDVADVLLLGTYQTGWHWPLPNYLIQATMAAAVGGGTSAQLAYSKGLELAEDFEPYFADHIPGSSFHQQLPAGGANRFALAVQQTTTAASGGPFSLYWPENDASGLAGALWAMGWGLHYYAVDLTEYVDTGQWESLFVLLSIASAQHLANIMVNVPYHWCNLVNGGFQTCLASDGFIPTGNQWYPGGSTTVLTGATHRFQPTNGFLINQLISRTASVVGS